MCIRDRASPVTYRPSVRRIVLPVRPDPYQALPEAVQFGWHERENKTYNVPVQHFGVRRIILHRITPGINYINELK